MKENSGLVKEKQINDQIDNKDNINFKPSLYKLLMPTLTGLGLSINNVTLL